jgi:hypothetical protein
MKIDWKKEIKLSQLRLPSMPRARRRSVKASKRSRPTLGGPQLHMPKFASDLYADLRDRHLLPIVALLIVAMCAAPILLPGKSDHEEKPAITPATAAGAEAADAGFTVVPAEPGLRDYKRRLAHRKALNPFRRMSGEQAGTQGGTPATGAGASSSSSGTIEPSGGQSTTYTASTPVTTQPTKAIKVGNVTKEVPISSTDTGPGKSGGSESTQVESTHSESAPVETTQTETTTVESSGAEGGSVESTTTTGTITTTEAAEGTEVTSQQTTPPKTTPPLGSAKGTTGASSSEVGGTHEIIGYTIDAEAGFVPHSTEKSELEPMTKLPDAQHPVVLFMGLSKDHKRALFLMTSQVTAYYGGHCALDKQACQLVEVKPGKGVTFAYGNGESRYKVHLKKIVPTLRFSK